MRLLVVAPHPDDEVLGVGGTMAENISKGNEVFVCIVTKGYPPLSSEERQKINQADAKRCHAFLGVEKTFFLDFPAVMLENIERYKLNDAILKVIREVRPEEVYIPHFGDMQKDHQVVAEACMVALRPKYDFGVKRVYGYETMSETAWNTPNIQNEFIPNTFVDISRSLEKKKEALGFFSLQIQSYPDARSTEAIEALAKYRGSLMNMNAAESFMLIRELK